MGILDIISGGSLLANPYGAPSANKWSLVPGKYKNSANTEVVFYYETRDTNGAQRTAVSQVADSGGRRLAIYEYPYKDGQSIADMGRKGETLSFNIQFFGSDYRTKLNEFLNVVNVAGQGTLNHPIRGAITARFQSFELTHRGEETNSVTIRATFLEDNTPTKPASGIAPSTDQALRSSLQTLTNYQSQIAADVGSISGALALPQAVQDGVKARLNAVTSQVSGLFGKLAATFGSDSKANQQAAQAANVGGIGNLNSGTVQVPGSTATTTIPPVFQVGFDPATQTAIEKQTSQFVNASQITPQQAVFQANQARQAISAAITEATTLFGNQGSDIVEQYRGIAVAVQAAVEASISSSNNSVTRYTVPKAMSLRLVASLNGLSPDRQNDISSLNPYLACVNYVLKGTVLTVPVS